MTNDRRTKLRSTLAAIVGYVYPPTKAKLHRLFHGALAALTVAGSVVLWVRGHKWGFSTWEQFEAQLVLAGAFLAKAGAVVRKLDAVVDQLPIPATDKPADSAAPGGAPSKLATLALLAAGSLCWPGAARADTSISKCWDTICVEPQVAVQTLVYRPTAGTLEIALPAGAVGYGVRLPSGYLSAGLFLNAAVGTGGAPSYLGGSLLITAFRAFTVGPVVQVVGTDAPWFGLAIGGSLTSTLKLEAP